jgi:hypothetical protein
MVEAALFIPLMIIAFTQMIKMAFPAINGFLTILIALVVGVVVSLLANMLGVTPVTVAQGIVYALGAVGITAVASKAGGGAKGDE